MQKAMQGPRCCSQRPSAISSQLGGRKHAFGFDFFFFSVLTQCLYNTEYTGSPERRSQNPGTVCNKSLSGFAFLKKRGTKEQGQREKEREHEKESGKARKQARRKERKKSNFPYMLLFCLGVKTCLRFHRKDTGL